MRRDKQSHESNYPLGELYVRRAHLVRQQRAEIDDLATPAGHHVLARGLAEEPARLEVDVQDLSSEHSILLRAQCDPAQGAGYRRPSPA